jgi:hypothetical protein
MVAGSRNKRIPPDVFQQDLERRQRFFDGYFEADGHQGTRTSKLTSVNRELLVDTLRLMQTIGMTGSLSSEMFNGQGDSWWDLYIHKGVADLTVTRVEEIGVEEMFTLSVEDERHAFSSEGLISKNSAAEVIKVAMVRAHQFIPDESRMLLTVHDEILVLAPLSAVDDTVVALRRAMEELVLPRISVPLPVDLHVVDRWGEAK